MTLFIALQAVFLPITAFADDSLVDAGVLDEKDYGEFLSGIGMKLDPDKTYEYVESVLFNTAPQEMWDLAKSNSFEAVANSEINGKKTVKLTTTGEKAYPEIFFWNEKSSGGRSANGNLFGTVATASYMGIRVYVNKPESGGYAKLSVMLGKMYTGYWSDSFYTYTLSLPKNAYEGYVYIPYSYFVNKDGVSFNASSGVNFIAFKFPENAKHKTGIHFGELALFRESTKQGPDNAGIVSKGVGVSLDSDTDYMFWDSVIFNNSTDAVWAKAKISSFKVTTGIKDKKYIPSDADSSIKLSATGEKGYPEIYFWNAKYPQGNATNGLLFGSNIKITDYEGIRVWLKADNDNPYSTVTVSIGKMFTGYWPSQDTGFYEYTVIIDNGFEGYVNIPFALFTNKMGVQLKVEDFNFIGFKHNEAGAEKGDLYISNLSVYGKNNGSQEKQVPIGVKLDTDKKYEFITSKVFAAASQEMWNQSKSNGIITTVGITDSNYIPEKGKTSVKISTTGDKPSPEIYYWNENSVKGRCTQGRFWGDLDNTLYDGIRLWIKIDSNNTYSKLEIYTGQMFTEYWPKESVGFFTYTVVIPRGGYEGYINIPFSAFVNKQGDVLNAQYLNFIAFKYNESGFKETDIYISDLTLYREAQNGVPLSPDGVIIGGNKLPENTVSNLPFKEEVLGNFKPESSKPTPQKEKPVDEKDVNRIPLIITSAVLLLILLIILLVVLKIRKNKIRKGEIK